MFKQTGADAEAAAVALGVPMLRVIISVAPGVVSKVIKEPRCELLFVRTGMLRPP